MELDYGDLMEKAGETAEKQEAVQEATGGVPTSPDEMTLSDLKEMKEAEETLKELFTDESSGGFSDVLKEAMKDDEIRMGAKKLIMDLKQSGGGNQENVKTSVDQSPNQTPNQPKTTVEPTNNSGGNSITMSPDELYNLTLQMMTNAKALGGENMTVDELTDYVQENEQLIKTEMQEMGGQ